MTKFFDFFYFLISFTDILLQIYICVSVALRISMTRESLKRFFFALISLHAILDHSWQIKNVRRSKMWKYPSFQFMNAEQDICLLPALMGDCHNYTQRWYYDSYEQQCRQFYYGGCGENENNFLTQQDCVNRCETAVTTPPPQRQPEFRTGNVSRNNYRDCAVIDLLSNWSSRFLLPARWTRPVLRGSNQMVLR